MDNTPFTSYMIEERSYVAYIKREIHNLVKNSFTEQRTGEIDIVVSELASNIVKHAGNGELLYRLCESENTSAFEIIAIDNGPGIRDKEMMIRDGISSTRTLGHGLGSIIRLSNIYSLYSLEGWGTIMYCRIDSENSNETSVDIPFAGLRICYPGETICGDGFCFKIDKAYLNIFLGDGLGHGINANEAVETATTSFISNAGLKDPSQILRIMHMDVKRTRGLVASVACVDLARRSIEICGVGNIAVKLMAGIISKNNNSYNGILGHNIPGTLNNSNYVLEKKQVLIMCSDGIKSRWDITQLTGILKYNSMVIAAAIYKDHARLNDDMTVLVAKIQ